MSPFKFLIFLVCVCAIACKKEDVQSGIVDKGILYDTANLGTKINIGEVGYGKRVFWGRNAEEIFVNIYAPFSGLVTSYQVDLTAKKTSRIEASVVGRNFDNSSMVVLGSVNNIYGYYLYQFNTGTYTSLLNVDTRGNSAVGVSGNAVFYRAYSSPGNTTPCPLAPGSCADWSPSASDFHFIDISSKKIVPLPNKGMLSFSKTGKSTVLVGFPDSVHTSPVPIYIFDNDRMMIVDSMKIKPVAGWGGQHGTIYFDDEAGIVK